MKAKRDNTNADDPLANNRSPAGAITFDQRLAYSLSEVASILGISYSSAFRLCQRGLLRSTPGLRRRVIGREELMRFPRI